MGGIFSSVVLNSGVFVCIIKFKLTSILAENVQ